MGRDGPLGWVAVPLLAVAIIAAATLIWSLTRGEHDTEPPQLPPVAASGDRVAVSDPYEWRTLEIGGGGFVTGLVATESDGESVVYARTDVGGAHRWDEISRRWTQMLRTGTVTDGELTANDYHVASIAVSDGDPDVVALAAGGDYNPGHDDDLDGDGRVLWSTDGGRSWSVGTQRWSMAGNQMYRYGSESLAIDPHDPQRAHLGTQREGLWSTRDGGTSWEQVPTDQVPDGVTDDVTEDQAGVNSVTYVKRSDGSGPATIVVGVANRGLYASIDGGSSWHLLIELAAGEIPSSAGPTDGDLLMSIDEHDRRQARLVRVQGAASGVISAMSVVDVPSPTQASRWVVAASPHDPDKLVLADEAVRDGHYWTSDDGGETWTDHDVSIEASEVPWLAATDLVDFMSTGRLVFDPVVPNRLWFAEGMGVWRTDAPTTETVEWTAVSQGIEEVVVSGIVVPPGQPPIVTVADRQGFRFPDLGQLPTRTLVDPRFASGSSVDFSAGDPTRLAWVGAESHLGPPRARPRGATSSDGGETWQEMAGLRPAMYGGEVAVSATDPHRIVWLPTHADDPGAFRTSTLGVFTSGDGGHRWQQAIPDDDIDSFHRYFWWFGRRALAADRVNGSFYLLSDERRFYESTNGGSDWRRAVHAPPCDDDGDCHVYGQVQAVPGRAGHLWASTGLNGLHRTTDAGASSWERIDQFAEARAFGFGAPVGETDKPTAFVYGRAPGEVDLGLWRSIDGGETWEMLTDHPGDLAAHVNAVAGDPDVPGRVYVGFAGAGMVHGDDPELR